MYNPYQALGQYSAPPSNYASFPGAPPGMAPPPGMSPAPGMPQHHPEPDSARSASGSFPAGFQPPANMPNINFSAPVIRLGTSTPAKPDLLSGRDERGGDRRRAGLGMGGGPGEGRGGPGGRGEENRLQQVQPQTKEEIIRTVFVSGITEGCDGDEGMERMLRAVGGLRRWVRAVDAEGKGLGFGFAEFEDAESLETVIEVLVDGDEDGKGVEVPVRKQEVKREENGFKKEEGMNEEEEEEVEKGRLSFVVDENSRTYLEQWEEQQGGVDVNAKQARLDHAREALKAVLKSLFHPSAAVKTENGVHVDGDGDVKMNGATTQEINGEIVTIPISAEDELSDIPAEMRETVAKEIAAFRDRSNRRDLERLKREEEMEQQERDRMMNGSRPSRLTSPPLSAPSGPGGANGVPVGPRDRSAGLNAPSGPKAFGAQIPRDYQKSVAFVNGAGSISAASAFDEDDSVSDEELEKRRKAKLYADMEKSFLDQERRWLNRERSRTAAVEREKARDQDEEEKLEEEKEKMARRLREWDDDKEAERRSEEYYIDRSMWMRNRTGFRQREIESDDFDREMERRETGQQARARERADNMAVEFLSRPDVEMREADRDRRHDTDDRRGAPEPARFQMKLGAKAQEARDRQTQKEKRTVAEVEGLLEDEEAEATTQPRKLIPIQFDKNDTASMTDEERKEAAKQLAAEIPSDKDGLWSWQVKWEFVDEAVIDERLKPFVQRKVVESLGVQEDMLVDVVVSALRAHKSAAEITSELEEALDEEAEGLVKKLWRMVIFFSESEKRGLPT